MRVLVVNPGSSTLKLVVLADDGQMVAEEDVPSPDGAAETSVLEAFLDRVPACDAAGVRFVHGGTRFRRSVLADDDVIAGLDDCAPLAPLHNPPALTALRVLRRRTAMPVVACFDTAFFAGLPAPAATYAVPRPWTEEWGIRRFGFHGLSHSWASRRAAELLGGTEAGLRLVTCHLGAGASLAAVAGGAPLDTTMGFTPLDGLVMATRCGALDPGILLWVERHHGLTPDDIERVLDRESGLLGVSGRSGDLRVVLEAADGGDEAARLAVAVYLHRLRGSVAAMVVALGGLDALVFTGGVGEHSAPIRADCCAGLGFLGLAVNPDANAAGDGTGADRDITAPGNGPRVLVLRAREDLEIVREVGAVLAPVGQ